MPTDDQQVLVTGQASTPASFVIPGNGQIRPKSVYAEFDGTSAVGDFIPCLKIISDGGEVVGIFPQDASVAAGSSVDATWGPFLRGAAGGGGLSTQTETFSSLVLTTCPSLTPTDWDWQGAAGPALLDLTTPTLPTVVTSGVYAIGVSFHGDTAFTAGKALEADLQTLTANALFAAAYPIADTVHTGPQGFVAITGYIQAGVQIEFFFINRDAVSRDCSVQSAYVSLIGAV